MADKNNYLSRVTYQGGKDSYEFPFSYLRKNFVKAQIDLSERESITLAYMVDYTIDGHTLNLTKPVDADKTITIYRETSSTPLVEYEDSSILRAYDLNLSQRQNLNILEEQTDIVGKNYSFTQDTKDYMYKNLMDTKMAIDNKMSETLDTVNASVSTMNDTVNTTKMAIDNKMSETLDTVDSKLTTAQADVKKAVSDMNVSLDDTKQFVISSVSTMNDTVNTTKKSVEDSLAEMDTTVANTKKSVEYSLATTTTNLNDALNTATSTMDSKISQASQALEDAKDNLETTKSDIEKALVDTQDSMKATENRVTETKADITKLADELKESESSLQDAIKNISTTNRNTAYEVGDQIHSSFLPFNCYITCVTAGTTGDTLPVIPEGDHDSGFTYTDGTATFKMDYWPLSINGKKPLNKAGDITINNVTNADTVDGYHESSFLRYRGNTNVDGEDTLWDQIGIKEYRECLPEGMSGVYGYGAVVSLPSSGARLDIWYNDPSSIEGGDGIWYRSGWRETKRPWVQLLDSVNYTKYVPTKTGDGASGTWPISISGNADKLDGYHASDIISKIYPVGSIYMSMSATNPATLFGVGTWARISQGRMLLGADDSTYKAGATGGEATHTLSVDEMPAHSHTGTTSWNGDHHHASGWGAMSTPPYGAYDADGNHRGSEGSDTNNYMFNTSTNGGHNHTFTTRNSGGGAAHNNMPPYLVCYIWQRTA